MDINQKIAQRRKELEMQNAEINCQENFKIEINPKAIATADRSSNSIDERIKAVVLANAEKELELQRSARKKIKNWEWLLLILGFLLSMAVMVNSFLIGALLFGVLYWYFNGLMKGYVLQVLADRAAIIEAKKFLNDF
jgi:hypothetical protein